MLPLIEETPVVTAVQLIGRQLLGWQLYLWFNLTAGNKSAPARPKHRFCPNSSHFDPSSTLFLPSQRPLIMLSNLGLCITIVSLCFLGAHLECTTVALLYFMPYLWVHHWIGKHTSFGLLNLSLKCFNSRYNISSPYTPICPTLHGRDVDIHKWGALHDRSELWGYRTSFFPRYLWLSCHSSSVPQNAILQSGRGDQGCQTDSRWALSWRKKPVVSVVIVWYLSELWFCLRSISRGWNLSRGASLGEEKRPKVTLRMKPTIKEASRQLVLMRQEILKIDYPSGLNLDDEKWNIASIMNTKETEAKTIFVVIEKCREAEKEE